MLHPVGLLDEPGARRAIPRIHDESGMPHLWLVHKGSGHDRIETWMNREPH